MSEPDVSELLTVEHAIAVIDATVVRPRVVECALADAGGLILAEDMRADRDYPPFDKSQMDGYALRAVDARRDARLQVVGEMQAGSCDAWTVKPGQAVAIMTGAPMPAGADCVVPVEEVVVDGDTIRIGSEAAAGRFIVRRGSDCAAGTTVLPAGVKLGPAQLAVAATVGADRVRVYSRPRVGVLSTGDEVVPLGQTPGPTQIRDSNGMMLLSLLRRLGCETIDLGHVRDEPAAVRDAIERGLQQDVLFITGGMSMGRYDFVPPTLRELGVNLHLTKLRIKPGKPFVFGSRGGAFVFGLPGNPVSAYVCTLRLAARLLDRIAGDLPQERWIDATLASPLPANGPREFYQPAVLHGSVATPLNWKGSAEVFTLAKADALLVRLENEPARAAGERVRLLQIPR